MTDSAAKTRSQPFEHSRIDSHAANTCATCSNSFSNNSQLEQHAAKFKHGAYLCICGKAFSRLSALRRHIEESPQVYEYQCPLCHDTKSFKRRDHVEQHLRLVHRVSRDAIKDLLSAQKTQLSHSMKKFREAIMTLHETLPSTQVPDRIKVSTNYAVGGVDLRREHD